MGNESGEWIMHGLEWDNPACIHTVEKAIEHINDVGFLPLFKNEIEGFSLEEWTAPEYWWCDDEQYDPWLWRAVIARQHDIIYGKFFGKRQVLYQENGFLHLLITGVTDTILMRYMRMEKHRLNIKRL